LENLRRSLPSLKQGSSVEDTSAGLEMVVQQFMSGFQALGLEEVPGEGAKFDPNLHEALSVIPVPDPALDDVIVSVFSAGYRIGTRLICPARVVVGQCSGEAADDGADDGAAES